MDLMLRFSPRQSTQRRDAEMTVEEQGRSPLHGDEGLLDQARPGKRALARRAFFKGAGALALALGTVELAGRHAVVPRRMVLDASSLPDIQFDIGSFSAAPVTLNDGGGAITAAMPPLHTVFVTAKLSRTPTRADQQNL